MQFRSSGGQIHVPPGWPGRVRSAMLHVASLAHWAVTQTRSWAANSPLTRVRAQSARERAETKVALLQEEIRIKDARMAKVPPRRRPFYPPTERMAILELRAARGWSSAQTAEAFQVEPDTVASWTRRVDEQGSRALLQLPEPINRFPDFVRHVVRRLKALCPLMGKKRIAQILSRAGLHLAATTVARMSNGKPKPGPSANAGGVAREDRAAGRVVTAKGPNHVWHADLTVVPTAAGFWTAWLPWALPQVWPFCYWVAVVVDHFSRRLMGFALFTQPPSSLQIRSFLGRAMARNKTRPRYIVCDKGRQFWCAGFKNWCKRKRIRPRYGAVGKYGSLAVIERFIRSMKDECTRRILVPFRVQEMRTELSLYTCWYNEHRPHQSLSGRTPHEVYAHSPPSSSTVQFRAGHKKPRLTLHVSYLGGRKHLPVVELHKAA